MHTQRMKNNSWFYGLVALIPVFGCLAVMASAFNWLPGLPEILDARIDIDNLTQVLVPGLKDITFTEKGAYAVYYEYRSVLDGVVYTSSETPPTLDCTLTSKASGEDIRTVPDYVKTNTYATRERERVGELIHSITIKEPGTYTFSCRYADGSSQPEIVLAVGPNFMWEFFSIVAKYGLKVSAGVIVLLVSALVAMAIVIVIALKRQVQEVIHESR